MSSLVSEIQSIFIARGLTLGLAESCTGGLLSANLTAMPGASKYFLGSIVSYHRQVKSEILEVPLSLLQVHGEVSLPVAAAMARGARAKLKCDWTIAITGVAGPSGGTAEKPVGFVCFSVIGPGYEYTEAQNFGHKDRVEIQKMTVEHALKMLRLAV
jgi:PncC family amidohydrolase